VQHGTGDFVERFETPRAGAARAMSAIVTLYDYADVMTGARFGGRLDGVELEIVVVDDRRDGGRAVVSASWTARRVPICSSPATSTVMPTARNVAWRPPVPTGSW
jgi:hypothetical protein